MSGLVIWASDITPPPGCLKGWSVSTSSSIVDPSSATGDAGMLKKCFTSKRTSRVSTIAGWLIFMILFSQSRSPAHSSLKKNQTTPRPSEHPPVMGEKMSKRLGGIKRPLQLPEVLGGELAIKETVQLFLTHCPVFRS